MSDCIPLEVQLDIVRRLSVKQVLQCRSVSKTWKAGIDTLHFTCRFGVRPADGFPYVLRSQQGFRGYMSYLSQNFSITTVPTNLSFSDLIPIGCSHGIWGFSYGPILPHYMAFVWNPSIRRSVGTFIPYVTVGAEYEKRMLAFGVRPDNLDPTILKISYPFEPQKPWCVLLFSFSTRQWNVLETQLLPRQSIRLKNSSQAVVDGRIFWCAYEKLFASDVSSFKSYMMVSFDLVTHLFQVLTIPDELLSKLPLPFFVSNLRDHVVVSGNLNREDNFVFCVWSLEVVGGIIESFECLIAFPTPCSLKLIGFADNNDPILEVENKEEWPTNLVRYNVASRNFYNIAVEGIGSSFCISPNCESLILQTHEDTMAY